ncbi:MAG: response regulator [Anaerolineae bacterium]|nr:response regulator [Anaerolineae bacterium]
MPTIRVIEDDREIAKMLLVAPASEEFYVVNAALGEEALRIARQKLPDFTSLDIRLPDLDGFEVL